MKCNSGFTFLGSNYTVTLNVGSNPYQLSISGGSEFWISSFNVLSFNYQLIDPSLGDFEIIYIDENPNSPYYDPIYSADLRLNVYDNAVLNCPALPPNPTHVGVLMINFIDFTFGDTYPAVYFVLYLDITLNEVCFQIDYVDEFVLSDNLVGAYLDFTAGFIYTSNIGHFSNEFVYKCSVTSSLL